MDKIIEMLPFLIPLLILQFSLLAYSLYHILTHSKYKMGSRTIWIIICACINTIGPILYILFGREDD